MNLLFSQQLPEWTGILLLAQTVLGCAIIVAFVFSRGFLARQAPLRRRTIYAATLVLTLVVVLADTQFIFRASKSVAGNQAGSSVPYGEHIAGRSGGGSQGCGSAAGNGGPSQDGANASLGDEVPSDGDEENTPPIVNMPRPKTSAGKDAQSTRNSPFAPENKPDPQKTPGGNEAEQAKKPDGAASPDAAADKAVPDKKPETTVQPNAQDKPQPDAKPLTPDAPATQDKPNANQKNTDTKKPPAQRDKPNAEKTRSEKDQPKPEDQPADKGVPDAGIGPEGDDDFGMGPPDAADMADESNPSNKNGETVTKDQPDGSETAHATQGGDESKGSPDGTTQAAQHKSEKEGKSGGKTSAVPRILSLATKQEGKADGNIAPPSDKPSTADAPKQTAAKQFAWPSSLIPRSRPAPFPTAGTASTADGKASERARLEGSLPPFRYVGATRELFKKYPRMEVAWVLDHDPGGAEPPQVVLEVVLDSDGEVHWQNLRSGRQSRFFKGTTVSYVVRERIVAGSASQLRLGREAALMAKALEEAALDRPPTSRTTWGYYRHQAETYELSRAARAYQDAAEHGIINFQPNRADSLEIRWAVDSQGEVYVANVRFCPENGKPVELPLAKE